MNNQRSRSASPEPRTYYVRLVNVNMVKDRSGSVRNSRDIDTSTNTNVSMEAIFNNSLK